MPQTALPTILLLTPPTQALSIWRGSIWGPTGAPVFSLYPGTYLTPELVTISGADPNTVLRYTTNGVNPTTNDSVIASGTSLLIYQTTTLKAGVALADWTRPERSHDSPVYHQSQAAQIRR